MQDRLNNLESKVNIMPREMNEFRNNFNSINNKIDKLINYIIKPEDKKITNNNNKNPYVDEKGNLNNKNNPFIKAYNNIEKKEENDLMSISTMSNKRKKYEPRDPIYYLYNIEGHIYKYTCKNKEGKNILPFYCSDTSCPAKANYNKLLGKFTLADIKHIEYEKQSYVLPKIIKDKYKDNLFKEEDFIDNLSLIGNYFKQMFLEDYRLSILDV